MVDTTRQALLKLEFTPLEFETNNGRYDAQGAFEIRIYSVGV